jgi:hypothetical protein
MADNIIRMDTRPIDTRLGPYLVNTTAATAALDEALGALTLAYEAVCREAGTNQMLAHAFCSMTGDRSPRHAAGHIVGSKICGGASRGTEGEGPQACGGGDTWQPA